MWVPLGLGLLGVVAFASTTKPLNKTFLTIPGYRRIKPEEVTNNMILLARDSLSKPMGTIIFQNIDNKDIAIGLESHHHPEGGPVKPWGWHKGASIFIKEG